MHPNNTVFDLAAIAVVLSGDADSIVTSLGGPGLIHTTDGLGMGVLGRHDLLAPVPQFLFVPLDRFEETLQRPRLRLRLYRDPLGGLAVQIGELSSDIDVQQRPWFKAAETVGKQREKRNQLPAQRRDLL